MTATHIDDADILRLNGGLNEETMARLINSTPGEGGAIPGTFRLCSYRDSNGHWFLAGVMDCACEHPEGDDFL